MRVHHHFLQVFAEIDSAVHGHDVESARKMQWRVYMVAELAVVGDIAGSFDAGGRGLEVVLDVGGYSGDAPAGVLALVPYSYSVEYNHHMVVDYAVEGKLAALVALIGCSHS